MLNRKITAIATSMALLFTFGLTGCSSQTSQGNSKTNETAQPKEEITFVNWATAEEATREQVTKVIQEFEKQNPNIKVKSVPVSVSDISNQLTIMVTGGNAPDISQIPVNDGVTLAAMGGIAESDELVPKVLANDPVYKKSWDMGMFNGKHYGLPWMLQPLGFWYNKTLMQQVGLDPNKPPKTWDELKAYMDQAKAKVPAETVLFGIDTTIRTLGLNQEWSYMRSFGAEPVKGQTVAANSQQMKNYSEWLRDLVKKGYTLPGKKYGEFRPLAAQNRLLFHFDGAAFKAAVQSVDKNITDEKFYQQWGVTKMPAGVDGKSYSVPDDHHLLIFKASKHKEAAVKFAEFVATSEVSYKEYVSKIGFVPASQAAVTKFPDLFGDPVRKAFVNEILPTEVQSPLGPDFAKVSTIIMAGIQEVVTTDKPIDTILNNVQIKLEGLVTGK